MYLGEYEVVIDSQKVLKIAGRGSLVTVVFSRELRKPRIKRYPGFTVYQFGPLAVTRWGNLFSLPVKLRLRIQQGTAALAIVANTDESKTYAFIGIERWNIHVGLALAFLPIAILYFHKEWDGFRAYNSVVGLKVIDCGVCTLVLM